MVSYAVAAYCPVLEPRRGFHKSEVGLLGTGALLAMVEEPLKLALVKEVFSSLLFFPTTSAITRLLSAQLHHHGMKEPPSPQLWPPAPFHSTTFSLLDLFRSQGNGFSLLPLLSFPCHSYCMTAVPVL